MKARWITVSAVAVLMAALTPLTAQAAPIQDPDDVSSETIDIKSASVGHTYVDGEGTLALTVESYEPFGCEDLAGNSHSGQSLAFVIDFPSTPRTHDMRIRVRCFSSGTYWWRAKLIEADRVVQKNKALRPTDTTLTILFSLDWYTSSVGGEEPARWKVISTRWVDSQPAEVDSAPDHGWGDFAYPRSS